MSDSYPFPMYSGLLEPEHYKNIGSAIWLFLWCISSTTKEVEEEGTVWGIVLRGQPVKISDLQDRFGVTDKTIRSWIKMLESHGYIQAKRAPYGLIFSVKKSKKYKNRSEENYRTEGRERKQTTDLNPSDRKNITDLATERSEENYRSNKDIIFNASSAASDDPVNEIEKHFCQRRGKGFSVSPTDYDEIKQMLTDGLPAQLIIRVINESFDNYKPKHKRDEIRSITYCVPRCYDEWTKLQQEELITDAVPHVSVAIGSPTQRPTKQQQSIDELQRMLREEQKREQNGSHTTPYRH